MMVYEAFRKRVIFAAMLPPCCHAPIYLYINVFRKIRGSVAAKSRKKNFFQFTARAIINGTLFRNNPRLLQNKARLLFNNPGLFGNTLGVIYFSFGEKYFLSDEKYFPSTVTRSYFGCSTYCLGESARVPSGTLQIPLLQGISSHCNDFPARFLV